MRKMCRKDETNPKNPPTIKHHGALRSQPSSHQPAKLGRASINPPVVISDTHRIAVAMGGCRLGDWAGTVISPQPPTESLHADEEIRQEVVNHRFAESVGSRFFPKDVGSLAVHLQAVKVAYFVGLFFLRIDSFISQP